jgi:hypothetical protein
MKMKFLTKNLSRATLVLLSELDDQGMVESFTISQRPDADKTMWIVVRAKKFTLGE